MPEELISTKAGSKANKKMNRKTDRKTGRIQADGRNEGWIKEEEI